jgi:hypothetical protein
MPFATAGKNAMLDALGITHVGAFTDFPTDSGAGSNEVAGGSYARQPISYSSASGGSKSKAAGTVSIPIPAGTTVYFLGGFSASTSGTMLKWAPINGGSVKGVGTAATTDVLLSNGHGLVDTDRVFLTTVNGESLPAGLSAGVLYYVVSGTTDTFKVSLTNGGSAVDVTGTGEFAFQKVIGETFASAGNLDVSVDTFDLNG